MRINNEEILLEKLVEEINPRNHLMEHLKNDIYLSQVQVDILKQYGFSYQKYSNVKSLILDIEDYLNYHYDEDLEELENVVSDLVEFDYYYNTNK